MNWVLFGNSVHELVMVYFNWSIFAKHNAKGLERYKQQLDSAEDPRRR